MLGYTDASASSMSCPCPSSEPSQPSYQNIKWDTNKSDLFSSDPGPRNTSSAVNTDEKYGYKSNLKNIMYFYIMNY